MHYAVSLVVEMVGDNKVAAAIAVAEVASVVDIGVEVVRVVATEQVTPRMYFVVAIVAVDIAEMSLVVVASFIPLTTLRNTLSIQRVYRVHVVQRIS